MLDFLQKKLKRAYEVVIPPPSRLIIGSMISFFVDFLIFFFVSEFRSLIDS